MKQQFRTQLKRRFRKLEFSVLSLAVIPQDRPALLDYLRRSRPPRVWIIYGVRLCILGLIAALLVIMAACQPNKAERLGAPVIDITAGTSLPAATIRPSTSTHTPTPTHAATQMPPTATSTAIPHTATPRPTAILLTAAPTAIPSTATPRPTVIPRTATPRPTVIPPTATPRPTAIPPTAAPTAIPPTAAPAHSYIAPGTWACPDNMAGAAYVGSINSDKFHKPNCRHVSTINAENRICFESREAATNYGRVACGTCKP